MKIIFTQDCMSDYMGKIYAKDKYVWEVLVSLNKGKPYEIKIISDNGFDVHTMHLHFSTFRSYVKEGIIVIIS